MRLKFAANLSWLFKEQQVFTDRYAAAAAAGFKAVESADPYQYKLEDLVSSKAAAGVEHVLMNGWPGEMSKGELGISAVPGRQEAFRDALETSIKYCEALKCTRLHIMAGRKTEAHTEEEMRAVYVDNLKYAADRLSKHNITALIEPVNSKLSAPGYFMDRADKALSVIQEVNHPNLKLQMDLFHIQIMHGNLTANIKHYLPHIGHMQLAQVPGRHEPNSAGEVNFTYLFKLLEELGYEGYIGLEYNPAGATEEGLQWFRDYLNNAE